MKKQIEIALHNNSLHYCQQPKRQQKGFIWKECDLVYVLTYLENGKCILFFCGVSGMASTNLLQLSSLVV